MVKQRIDWNGETSTVAFVFEFIGDIEPEDVEFDAYQNYEKAYPGSLVLLKEHYEDNEEAWKSNEVELTAQQIEQLQVYIECVNSWIDDNEKLFLAMNTLYYTNMEVDNWDEGDNLGLTQFIKDVDWWRDSKNWEILSSDIFYRIEDKLGEESYLYAKLCDYNQDELLEYFYDFWAGQFSLEVFLENNEDEISENEKLEITSFLNSNILLVDFKYSSTRYHTQRKA
jgi:hypothetical protein